MWQSALLGVGTAASLLALYSFMWWRAGPRLERAREMLKNGARLVDVDEPYEFEADPIEGALNIPLQDLARRAHELGPHEHPVLVCGHRKLRTAQAAQELRSIGFHQVVNVGQARL